MPNHITNELTITGDDREIVFEAIKGEWKDEPESPRNIDFEKITPMPESLRFEPHSGIENAVNNALQSPVNENPLIGDLQRMNRANAKSPLELKDDEWEKFIIGLNNVRKYGCLSWYNWSIKNWGTKWNAYDQQERDGDTIRFDTAWSGVTQLLTKLSTKFPSVTLNYRYADEDTGSNVGILTITDGAIAEDNSPKNQSKEAYELAFELKGGEEYYNLVDNNYVYNEEMD